MPTIISFFGLLNIQQTGNKLSMEPTDLFCQLSEITDDNVFSDGHAFNEPDNFRIVEQSIKMVDYGSLKTQAVLEQYGLKIVQNFNFSYDWEKRKRELRGG